MEELNGELFGDGLVSLGDEGSLESTDSGKQEQNCKICDNKLCSPRVLSCLHVFCEACIDKLMVNEAGDSLKFDLAVECPLCKQETKMPGGGAMSLPSDYVLTNILDVSSMDQSVVCTCCKSKEPAVARCTDCSHFLCANCNSAHEFMRCFENHRVVPFDALRSSKEKAAVHKPIFCTRHAGESLKFYCCECEVGACSECLTHDHKVGEHRCERIVDAEPNLRAELRTFIVEANSRAVAAGCASVKIDDALGDLQRQRDDAENIINEAFHAYKSALERRREKALEELERLHKERELKVMDLFDRVDKTVQRIDCACKFAARLLRRGDGTEIVMLKKTVASQFTRLLEGAPEFDVDFSLEFVTKMEKFDSITEESFGTFRTEATRAEEMKRASESSAIVSVTSNSHSPAISVTNAPVFDDYPLGNVRRVTGVSVGSLVGVPGVGGVPTIGVPGVGAVTGVGAVPNTGVLPGVVNVNSVGAVTGVGGVPTMPSMVEYNLQQLASIAEKDVPPPPHASPAPPFTLAELLAGDLNSPQAYNNLQALAKLGLNADVNGFGGVGGVGNIGGVGPRGVSPGRPLLTPAEEAALVAPPAPLVRANKATPMHIRFKFGQLGGGKGQFNSPHGFCLGNDEDIIVADTNNHRITVFDKSGNHKFNFGVAGKEEGQLWYPRKVAVVRATGKFVVCDRGNERSRMQIFTKNGHFLKKIAVRFIDIVAGLAVTAEGLIVAVDSVTPTVFILSEEGDLMSWFDCSECMREPSDIAISGKEFYVCDFKGHCVVVFDDEGRFLRRIGCENVTNFPNGIDVSDAGDVLIGDSHGNKFHVAVFSRDGALVTEFECPYVKVSRCCGLKITSEGYIVTLAKNNHHVLVLNTLYIV
ncbi:brain tumor protein-like isoform X2 [Pararge aegeria]|uniref:Jg11632 protein n=1 Tax=Pararge aegeria aegeria TaxID=348720 RepID=A0A8S4RNA3_9NEOP|nr:brain tumor protein-like isoform X2 [Pararge aegeria]CAH2238748.1 jg11632 [Pararge aegeria aegeria]